MACMSYDLSRYIMIHAGVHCFFLPRGSFTFFSGLGGTKYLILLKLYITNPHPYTLSVAEGHGDTGRHTHIHVHIQPIAGTTNT